MEFKANYPKISIITPSYNDGEYLERTILSILSQNYPNLEYIIIDGGSNDGSVDIIKKYADKLAYWVSEPDKGMYYALQKGFSKSTGEVMGWLNSDDMLHTLSLFTIGQVFGDFPEIKWLQGIPNTVDEDDRIVHTAAVYDVDKLFFYQKKHVDAKIYIQQESTFWRRDLWQKAGDHISTDYKFAGDFELWIRFFQFEKLHNIYAFTGSFRLSKSGQASVENYPAYVDETLHILERYPLSEKEKKQIKTEQFFKKIESRISRLKAWVLRKKQLDSNSVINHRLYFNHKLQKFDLNK
ncbi:MAG TPA: glycosyltransferase family 2 protein [Mucilaginibacter sp.]|jgi:glycosyltransferase involved in cell wall biosynthesis